MHAGVTVGALLAHSWMIGHAVAGHSTTNKLPYMTLTTGLFAEGTQGGWVPTQAAVHARASGRSSAASTCGISTGSTHGCPTAACHTHSRCKQHSPLHCMYCTTWSTNTPHALSKRALAQLSTQPQHRTNCTLFIGLTQLLPATNLFVSRSPRPEQRAQ